MPRAGVSVPRGKARRGDRWSDDLELEIPARRAPSQRRAGPRGASAAPAPSPAASPQDDPYNLELDLHVEFGLTPRADRAPRRPEPVRPKAAVPEPARAPAATPERRTVTIQGRPSDRYQPAASSRRRQPPPHHRVGFQPDRVALWAVFLGLALLLVAATSSHAAVLSVHGLATLAAR